MTLREKIAALSDGSRTDQFDEGWEEAIAEVLATVDVHEESERKAYAARLKANGDFTLT